MALWIIAISVGYGLLVLLDPLMYSFIVYELNVSSIYLGICNAMWSVIYIITTMFLGFLADEGKSRTLMIIALISITLSWFTMCSLNPVTAFISYILHSVSMASTNLALNSIILESIDSHYWGRVFLFTRVVSNAVRGFSFIVLALMDILSPALAQQTAITTLLISIIFSPSHSLISERSIYKLYKLSRSMGSYIKASTSLLYIDKPSVARTLFEKVWSRDRTNGLSAGRVATLIMFVTCIGDYVLAFLPIIIKNRVGLQTLWVAYGITSIFSIIMLYILRSVESGSRGATLMLILIRSALLMLGINIVNNITSLTLYLIVNSALFSIIDVMLHNIFISSTAGYGVSLYYTLRELGSIVGSILGGFLLAIGMGIYIEVAIVLTIATVFLMI